MPALRMAKIVVSVRLGVACKAATSFLTHCFDHTFLVLDCGNSTTVGAAVTLPENCNSPCVGDPREICGGSNSLSLYWNGFKHYAPDFLEPLEKWRFVGCYK